MEKHASELVSLEKKLDPNAPSLLEGTAEQIFQRQLLEKHRKTDKMFVVVFVLQWILVMQIALYVTPRTWIGDTSLIHIHVLLSIGLGALLIAFPIFLIYTQPGKPITRYAIAFAQSMYSVLIIHLTGGRTESHFHIFGSLAFLALYKDWGVLALTTGIIGLYHAIGGIYFPLSVFGETEGAEWRWMEHVAWVLFEDCFLFYPAFQYRKDLMKSSNNQAELEITKSRVEDLVISRTKILNQLNQDYMEQIIQRKQSEEALIIESSNLNQAISQQNALMNNIPDRVWIKDLSMNFLLCNRPFADSVFTSPDDIAGKSDFDFFPDDLAHKYRNDDLQVMRSGERMEMEEEFVSGDTKRIWIQTIKTPIRDEASGRIIGTVGIARDVTNQRLSAEKLREAYSTLEQQLEERESIEKQLVHAQKMDAIGTLTGGIAHDFNNILWMILGNSELLISENQDNEFAREMSEDIHQSALRAKGLVQQLLDFSRKSESERINFDILPLLKETFKLLRSSIPTSVQLQMDFSETGFEVLGDPNKFHQVVMNLCMNAYHAIKDNGKITISTRQYFISEEDTRNKLFRKSGNFVCLEVSDTGCGMPPEVVERIFEPFFTTKEVGKGTGLGLSMVHGIVEEMDGFINVYSEVGIGSSFKIYLPISNGGDFAGMNQYVNQQDENTNGSESSNETSVMVVDDEEMLRKMLQRTLTQMGLKVTTFSNGAEALKAFQENPDNFDLILTDQTMPVMTGVALAREVNCSMRPIPVILASGNVTTITPEEMEAAKLTRVLNKPIQIADLQENIRAVLKDMANPTSNS